MKEYEFGEMLEKITGFKWYNKYLIDGGKYKLDFYLPGVLIIEYYKGSYMDFNTEDDFKIRYCRDWLSNNEGDGDGWKCPVILVKEGEELEGLNRIIRHLAGFEEFDTQYNYNLQVCDYGNE